MRAIMLALNCGSHPLLAAIFCDQRQRLIGPDELMQFALHNVVCFGVIAISPCRELQHGPNLGPASERGAEPATCGPIFLFRAECATIGGTHISVAVQHVERLAAVVESIGMDVKINAVDPKHSATVVAR